MTQVRSGALALSIAVFSGCSGQIAGTDPGGGADSPAGPTAPRAPGPTSPDTPRPDGPAPTAAPPVAPPTTPPPPLATGAGPRPLRRLSRVEYENTVRALLGIPAATAIGSGLPDDARGPGGFELAGAVGEVDVQRLQEAAERLAALAVSGGKLLPCTPDGANELSCVRQFIEAFGRRAYRRPLDATERADLEALYDRARKELKLAAPDAVTHLVAGILQAPQFLYLWERSPRDAVPNGAVVRLGPHELASRLSYLFLRSMPDDALFAAADGGRLSTPADVSREAKRLLADPRSRDTVAEFVRQWLHLSDDDSNDLARAAGAETAAFVKKVVSTDGLLSTLLTSPVNHVNEALAAVYGVKDVKGAELRETTVDPARRFGLLTQVSFLGTNADGKYAHPIKRGAVIFRQLLCGEMPDPPQEVPQPRPPKDGVPNRERFAEHGKNACAAGCHGIIDPLGFAFDNYDGQGRYITTDGGKAIDPSGTVSLPGGPKWTWTDAKGLVEQIAGSETARRCAATQWLRYALARRETPADAASLSSAAAAFAAGGHDLRALLIAVTETPSFLGRAPAPGEGGSP